MIAREEFPWPKARRAVTVIGVLGAGASAWGWWTDPLAFFPAYLWAYRLVLSCGLGSLAVLAIHHLVGGGWGGMIRRPLEAAALTLPWLGLLFVPIGFGLGVLFPWARPEAARDAVLVHQAPYLNAPFMVARAALYFVVWTTFARWLSRLSDRQDRTGDPALLVQLSGVSAACLVVYGLTTFFAAVDWGVAIEAHWFSTGYPLMVVAGQIVAGFAVAIATLAVLHRRAPIKAALKAQHLNDLGNLLLAAVMVWAYVSYAQLIVIWSGNLPADISWYTHRAAGGWAAVGGAVAALGLALPFAALLSRAAKRHPTTLLLIALLTLAGHALDTFWQVVPSYRATAGVHWLDLVLPTTLGAMWLRTYMTLLARRPLLPCHGEPVASTPDQAYHASY